MTFLKHLFHHIYDKWKCSYRPIHWYHHYTCTTVLELGQVIWVMGYTGLISFTNYPGLTQIVSHTKYLVCVMMCYSKSVHYYIPLAITVCQHMYSHAHLSICRHNGYSLQAYVKPFKMLNNDRASTWLNAVVILVGTI